LVSRSISRETLQQHIRHSLLLEGVAGLKKTDLVVDAGAGGGLPGIPLAIANPEKKFLLNDISTKKGLALKQIIHQLSLSNVFVQKCSIADIDVSEPFNLISKHAFKIDDLYQMVSSFCWRNLIFYKGVGFEGEIKTIESSLCINVYRLSKNGYSDFYNGKVIVKIAR
jgi:16S rRNA (guanine527-N7)-methyltransferase